MTRLLGLVTIGMLLSAQLSTAAGQACTDTVPRDTVRGIAYGHIAIEPLDALPRPYLEAFLQRLSAALIDEPVFIRPAYAVTGIEVAAMVGDRPSGAPLMPLWPGYPELVGGITFSIQRSGEIVDARAHDVADLALTTRMLEALQSVHADSFPPGVAREEVRATLRLGVGPDSAASASQPLLELVNVKPRSIEPPDWRRERPYPPGPRYPDGEVMRRAEAMVVTWVDVDESGVPNMRTFGAATSAADAGRYRAFVDAVRVSLGRFRFQPLNVGGCPEPARVIYTTRFGIGPRMQTRMRVPIPSP